MIESETLKFKVVGFRPANFKKHLCICFGVNKTKFGSMKKKSIYIEFFFLFLRVTVKRVAHERMPGFTHVNADLVGSSGLELNPKVAHIHMLSDFRKMGDG